MDNNVLEFTVKQKVVELKPFVKWVGGKGQLIEQLEKYIPADGETAENFLSRQMSRISPSESAEYLYTVTFE